MMYAHNPPNHIVFHGGDMETVFTEIELGHRAAFDLYHHDSVMFCKHGVTAIDGECYHEEEN